jgi:hypothetical protein
MKSFLKFLKEEEKKPRKASQRSDVRAEAQRRVDYTRELMGMPDRKGASGDIRELQKWMLDYERMKDQVKGERAERHPISAMALNPVKKIGTAAMVLDNLYTKPINMFRSSLGAKPITGTYPFSGIKTAAKDFEKRNPTSMQPNFIDMLSDEETDYMSLPVKAKDTSPQQFSFLSNKEKPESRNTNQPQETPPFEKVASQYLNVNSQLNPYNSNWVTDMYMAKNISEPSMAAHKAWETDVGMAFDQDPMTKELIASPEGFKAVHKRTKENRNVKFTPLTIDQYRSDIGRGIFGGNQ